MSDTRHILLVDDDAGVAATLARLIEAEGYRCTVAGDGQTALEAIREHAPDLIILDRMLPGMSGDEVLRRLRRDPGGGDIPVIMLTGKGEEADELVGLALGADDYLGKPVSGRRLLARVEALLRRRRATAEEPAVVDYGTAPAATLTGERPHHVLSIDDSSYRLTATEYRLVTALIAARGFVLDRMRLTSIVRGAMDQGGDVSIDTEIEALRRKLGPAAECIQVVAGAGYAFCAPPGSTVRIWT
jgi:DNA-binding response OmpR family regulator